MSNSAEQRKQTAIAAATARLYEAKLHQREVWDGLQQQLNALQRPFFAAVALVVSLGMLALILLFFGHNGWAYAVIVFAVYVVFRQRNARHDERRRLAQWVRKPGVFFPTIAVNKILMEVCERVPEANDYIAKVNAGGRYVISDFERKQFVNMLAALDNFEREQKAL